MKIKISTINNGIQEVDAQEVKVKGQGSFRFFIHKTFKSSKRNDYTITEYRSGVAVCQEYAKKDCIPFVERALKKYSKKKWNQVIKKAVKFSKLPYPLNK